MKPILATLCLTAALMAAPSRAAVTFEFLFDEATPQDVSDDGTVVVGVMRGSPTSFRWTQATGVVDLGRPMVVGQGGVTGVSADGSTVAASIGSVDGSYTTQGRWTQASGWQELAPPLPPDGGLSDGAYANGYGISGDGLSVVGLYWRPGVGNRAHASGWTAATGVQDLGGTVTGQASRANGVNHNGSVIVGWVETPQGPWRPAAWTNGSTVLLTEYDPLTIIGSGEARAVSPDGDRIVGYVKDAAGNPRGAAMWTRVNGTYGPPQLLGWVDGTEPGGIAVPHAVSGDGHIVIGYASFDGSPFATTGFVWTPQTGVKDVNEFLAANGVFVDPNFTIQSLTAMTPDGTQIVGRGQMLTPPYTYRAFRISIPATADAPGPVATRLEMSVPDPNPSRGTTRLDYALAEPGDVDLSVFDAAGRRVATLLHGSQPAGRGSVTWDGQVRAGGPAPAGLYFARLTTRMGATTRRIVRVH